MAKQTRRRFTDEEKQKHIEEHKEAYLSNKRAKINGEPATEELFNALPINEQWDKIKNRLPKPKQATTPYQEVRTRLTFIKNNVDNLTEEQMSKVYEMFEDIKQHDAERAKRREAEEAKRLDIEIKEMEAELEEKRELLKIFTEKE